MFLGKRSREKMLFVYVKFFFLLNSFNKTETYRHHNKKKVLSVKNIICK